MLDLATLDVLSYLADQAALRLKYHVALIGIARLMLIMMVQDLGLVWIELLDSVLVTLRLVEIIHSFLIELSWRD